MAKFLAFFQLIPGIIKAVRELEEAIPLPEKGATKIELLLGLLRTFYDAEESIRKDIPWNTLEGVIRNAVGLVVGAFKALGVFKGKEQV